MVSVAEERMCERVGVSGRGTCCSSSPTMGGQSLRRGKSGEREGELENWNVGGSKEAEDPETSSGLE